MRIKNVKTVVKEEGYGNCPDCDWYNDPEGCNVKRDSSVCKLNKRPRKNEDRYS